MAQAGITDGSQGQDNKVGQIKCLVGAWMGRGRRQERAGKGWYSCLLFSHCSLSCPSYQEKCGYWPADCWLACIPYCSRPLTRLAWTPKRQGNRKRKRSLCDRLAQDMLEMLKYQFILLRWICFQGIICRSMIMKKTGSLAWLLASGMLFFPLCQCPGFL